MHAATAQISLYKSSLLVHSMDVDEGSGQILQVPRPLDKCVIKNLISQPKYMLWVLKEPLQKVGSFEHPNHMLTLLDKKIYTILHSKSIQTIRFRETCIMLLCIMSIFRYGLFPDRSK